MTAASAESAGELCDHPLALGVGGEQERANVLQAGNVVHVGIELGHAEDRGTAGSTELVGQAAEIAPVAPGEDLIVPQRRGDPPGEIGIERALERGAQLAVTSAGRADPGAPG